MRQTHLSRLLKFSVHFWHFSAISTFNCTIVTLTDLGEPLIDRTAVATARTLLRATSGTAGAAAGTAILPVPIAGAVIGFAIGVMIETVASSLYDAFLTSAGLGSEDTARAEGSQNAGRMIRTQMGKLTRHASLARNEVFKYKKLKQSELRNAATQEQVNKIRDWANAEKAKSQPAALEGDFSLYERLIREWVLEHAGDEEDANKLTSEAQWEQARQKAFGGGRWGDLDNHPELFAYQTRLQWREAGLGGDKYVDDMMNWLSDLQKRNPQNKAEEAKKHFNDKKYIFTHTDNPKALNNWLADNGSAGEVMFAIDLLEANKFRIVCSLDLTTSDGSCYVDGWEYEATLSPQDSPVVLTSFTVSPD